MGIYNFQKRFVPFILSGEKTHTIRAHRKYPDTPGNILHLYTGLGHPGAMLLMRIPCLKIEDIHFEVCFSNLRGSLETWVNVVIDGQLLKSDEMEIVARHEGFEDFAQMMEFWNDQLPFQGQIIYWKCPEIVSKGPFEIMRRNIENKTLRNRQK